MTVPLLLPEIRMNSFVSSIVPYRVVMSGERRIGDYSMNEGKSLVGVDQWHGRENRLY